MRTRSTLPEPSASVYRRWRAATVFALAAVLVVTMGQGAPAIAGEPAPTHLSGAELTGDPELARHYTTDTDPARTGVAFTITGVLTDHDGAPLGDRKSVV